MTFDGRWRITAMELWDQESLDLVVPAYIQFEPGGLGEFQFIAVQGCIDCEYGERDGSPLVEFSWEGDDDGDSSCGRGWAVLQKVGSLAGHLFFHRGDDSTFTAVRPPEDKKIARPRQAALTKRGR